MKSLKIYILEDEIITQEVLANTLESLGYYVCGRQTNAEKALIEIEKLKPDLAFLDIKVIGEKTGIWLAKQLTIPFIYLTAFVDSKHVKEAANTNPLSYLQKPFKDKDVFIAMQLAKNKIVSKKEITIRENNINVKIKVDDILYAKKEDHYFALHLVNSKKKLYRSTVKNFLETVTEDFIQIHRSYIINRNYVTGFSKNIVKIEDEKLPVSNSYVDKVTTFLS